MIKFPSIRQFRDIIGIVRSNYDFKGKDEYGDPIYRKEELYPKLKFNGTVKMNGANHGIIFYPDLPRVFQSREMILDSVNDPYGFRKAMINKHLEFLTNGLNFKEYLAVYGEWVGRGVQSKGALSILPKRFIIFHIEADGKILDIKRSDPTQDIYHVKDFQNYNIEIDFEDPKASQHMLEQLSNEVGVQCPIAKYFSVVGGGEGIVWTCPLIPKYKFKVVVKHMAPVIRDSSAALDPIMIKAVDDFTEVVVTENRLLKGIDWLVSSGRGLAKHNVGEFIRWMNLDILREEKDGIEASNINLKRLANRVGNKSLQWYFLYVEEKVRQAVNRADDERSSEDQLLIKNIL